ncbi:MAG: Dps family protein [Candidatus Woesearchaeota archaeon]
MQQANIGLTKEQREQAASILNVILGDETVLYQKTRNFHWNVRGKRFNDLHAFFEKEYNELETVIDDVAERARSLGVFAKGTLQELKEVARIQEQPGVYPAAEDMLRQLLVDHESIIRHLREDITQVGEEIGDVGTEDFLTGLLIRHEKTAWMLRSLLEE